MPESFGMLVSQDSHFYDHGRGLHKALRDSARCPGVNRRELASDEPERLAEACFRLGLKHVVVTSVTRDDLPGGCADHFRRCILAVRARTGATIEVLTPDFDGDASAIDVVLSACPKSSTTTSSN